MKRALMATAVALLAVAAAGCGSGYGGSKSSSSQPASGSGSGGQVNAAGVSANNHGTKTVSGETKVMIADYYFSPTILKGKPGQKVTLELENQGSVEHSFTIGSQSIDKVIAPGENAKVTVTIPKSGSVSFYCKFHKSSGMAGALVTSGSSAAQPMGTNQTTTSGGGYGGYGK
jgi:plastocyanin